MSLPLDENVAAEIIASNEREEINRSNTSSSHFARDSTEPILIMLIINPLVNARIFTCHLTTRVPGYTLGP